MKVNQVINYIISSINPTYNISKSKLKDIKSTLYNIENKKKIVQKKLANT